MWVSDFPDSRDTRCNRRRQSGSSAAFFNKTPQVQDTIYTSTITHVKLSGSLAALWSVDHRGVIRSNRHYFGISSVCLSILILRKITQPRLCGPIRAQHTDEVAWFYSNEKRKADPKIVTVASNHAAVKTCWTTFVFMSRLKSHCLWQCFLGHQGPPRRD